MGGSRVYKIKKLKTGGKIKGSPGNSSNFLNAVESGIQNQILSQAVGALISYSTPLNTLVCTLKMVKLAYEMYSKGKEAYDSSGGDENEAIKAAAGVVIEKAVDKLKSEAIRIAVSSAIGEQKMDINDTAKTIIVDSISGVIEGALT